MMFFRRSTPQSPYRALSARRRGSLTVYFALTFAVMLLLITTAIFSSKVAAGRARLASAARQSIESVFARYDTTLSDRYQLYFVDGGCGTASLQTDSIIRFLDQSSAHLLNPAAHHVLPGSSFLSFRDSSYFLDGMTMATDLGGMVFRAQAVQSIKDLPVRHRPEHVPRSAPRAGRRAPFPFGRGLTSLPGEPLHQEASELSESEKASARSLSRASNFLNFSSKNLLSSFVLEGRPAVSQKTVDLYDALSRRHRDTGFGIMETAGTKDAGKKPVFVEYLLRHMNRYGETPSDITVLEYEAEYLIAGKSSDSENLNCVIRRLLLKRQSINFIYLETDPYMRGTITQAATDIALTLAQPALEPAIHTALASAWALAESFVDLRSLYAGNRIARVKSAETWQVPLDALPDLFSNASSLEINVPGGIDYREALESLLLTVPDQGLTFRAMDLMEFNIRKSGHPFFSFDHCFDAMRLTLCSTVQQDVPVSASSGFSFRSGR